MLYNGQPSAYAQRLKIDYGEEIITELERERLKTTKLSIPWYQEKVEHYKSLYVNYDL